MPETPTRLGNAVCSLPGLKAHFSPGTAGNLIDTYCHERGLSRLLIVGSHAARTRYDVVWQPLGSRVAGSFFGAAAHCPEAIVEKCRQEYLAGKCDACIVVGGGSTLGLGKILKAEEGAHFVAVPTTYSGSEATAIYGKKIGHQKRTKIDERCRPDLIVYDADLGTRLPRHIRITSAMNSIAHAVEALYPASPNPLAELLARDCLKNHRQGFEFIQEDKGREGRESLLYGGFLGGLVIGMTGIALHHNLCHVIGGMFDLPHGESNAIVLPHVVAFNGPATPAANSVLREVLGDDNPASALFDFAKQHGAPTSLKSIGMPESGIDSVMENMMHHGGYNPRTLERHALRQLIHDAYFGNRPE